MKLFKKNKKQENSTWTVYQSSIGENPAIISVDTSFVNTKYKHTLSVNVAYNVTDENKLPDKEQNNFINQIEDMIIEKLEEDRMKIYFVGSASFNGAKYLIFVTNEQVDWKSYMDVIVTSPRIAVSVYSDDHMGYYNNILYPPNGR